MESMQESETTSAGERRAHERYDVPLAIQIDAERRPGRFGVLRNGSASGALFVTPSHFLEGEKLELMVLLPKGLAVRVTGRVVRARELTTESLWRFAVAAKFDVTTPILGDVLRTLVGDAGGRRSS